MTLTAEQRAGIEQIANGEPPTKADAAVSGALDFLPLAELRARVHERGPRKWLLRHVWPDGAYGVHAAVMKAQKTWNVTDLGVSVGSGTPWLDHVPVDHPGPVILFWGEGDDASLVRRIDAICASRGLDPDELPMTVCCRAPHLGDEHHLSEFHAQVKARTPRLVVLDPFYLSAPGANGADLYAMGQLLEQPQRICTAAGCSLLLTTHFNRREGRGADRVTGAGPAEWGRVLILGAVKSRRTDPATRATTVITELDFIGGDIPDQALRVTRTIRADDPADLDSPLRYEVSATDAETGGDSAERDMPPARRKLLDALQAANGPRTGRQLVDWIAEHHGHGLTRQTVSSELNVLLQDGLADSIDPPARGDAKLWITPKGVSP